MSSADGGATTPQSGELRRCQVSLRDCLDLGYGHVRIAECRDLGYGQLHFHDRRDLGYRQLLIAVFRSGDLRRPVRRAQCLDLEWGQVHLLQHCQVGLGHVRLRQHRRLVGGQPY